MNKSEAKRLMNRIDKVLYGHVEDDENFNYWSTVGPIGRIEK